MRPASALGAARRREVWPRVAGVGTPPAHQSQLTAKARLGGTSRPPRFSRRRRPNKLFRAASRTDAQARIPPWRPASFLRLPPGPAGDAPCAAALLPYPHLAGVAAALAGGGEAAAGHVALNGVARGLGGRLRRGPWSACGLPQAPTRGIVLPRAQRLSPGATLLLPYQYG